MAPRIGSVSTDGAAVIGFVEPALNSGAPFTSRPQEALLALALHPLVDSVTVARDLLQGYMTAIPEVADVLGSKH